MRPKQSKSLFLIVVIEFKPKQIHSKVTENETGFIIFMLYFEVDYRWHIERLRR